MSGYPSGECYSTFRDSANRASACAGTAVDAFVGSNFEFAVAHADSANGALTFTGTTGNARIIDNVCHNHILLIK